MSRLAKSDRVRVVAECGDGREAVEAVRRWKPDILFLDVQMPGLDGFGVVDALAPEARPHVVFVTAHDRHAVEAFRVRALDYLVKPIDDARFADALGRAVEAAEAPSAAGATSPPEVPSRCFRVRAKGRLTLLRHSEVDWIEAEGDYLCLHAAAARDARPRDDGFRRAAPRLPVLRITARRSSTSTGFASSSPARTATSEFSSRAERSCASRTRRHAVERLTRRS